MVLFPVRLIFLARLALRNIVMTTLSSKVNGCNRAWCYCCAVVVVAVVTVSARERVSTGSAS